MLPGFELANCLDLAVPADVMHHVVRVESSYNPFAIGVVGGRLARQPRALPEALATARMLERRGFDFSLGLAQVNRRNLGKYGLATYAQAFEACANVRAGSRILAECNTRAGGDWGKSFSCYYSGNFSTGFRHGYVDRVFASMGQAAGQGVAIPVIDRRSRQAPASTRPRAMPNRRPPPASALAGTRVAARMSAAPVTAAAPIDSAFVF